MPGTPPWHRTTWRLSVFYLLLTELKEGSDEAGGAINSPGSEEKYPKIPYLSSSSKSPSSKCTQVLYSETSLAATRDLVEESDENNNTDPEEKPQASSRSSISSRRAVLSRAGVSSRKKRNKAAS